VATALSALLQQGRDQLHFNTALSRRVAMKETMKHMRASLTAAALACVFAGSLAFAKTPEPAPAGSTTPTPAAPASSESSDVSKVEKWTKSEWNNAVKQWAQDKTKWAGCREQSKARKLSGRKSWSFLYRCMTE
jgi:hypothetical protein